ncbi:hypothetical protein HDU93_004990 [Gonapodya sp. JEL0774]|nr:hypothetical protein HDU93_004990 [Gonapodya sp. JEL0774]
MVVIEFAAPSPPYAEVLAILTCPSTSSSLASPLSLRQTTGPTSVTFNSLSSGKLVTLRGKVNISRYFARLSNLAYDDFSLAEQGDVDDFLDICRKETVDTAVLSRVVEERLEESTKQSGQFLFGSRSPALGDFVTWDLLKASKASLKPGTAGAQWFAAVDGSDIARKASSIVQVALTSAVPKNPPVNGVKESSNILGDPLVDPSTAMLPSNAPKFLPSIRSIVHRCFQNAITECKFSLPDGDPLLLAQVFESAQAGVHYQCNNSMSVFGKLKSANALPNGVKSPRDIASKIVSNLDANLFRGGNTTFEPTSIAGAGFINVRVTAHTLAQRIHRFMTEGVQILAPSKYYGKRVVIDFSSPNVAKEMHVGHLRSTIIGETLARSLEFCGVDLVRLNHIGDWGTQFGMLIEYMADVVASGDAEGLDPDTERVADLQVMYRAAKFRFDKDEDFKTRARLAVTRLQSGDPGSIRRWQRICDASRREFQAIYDRLGANIQERGESFYNPMLAGVVEELQKLNVAQESEGAMCVFVKGRSDPLIIRKSDGGYGYGTTDMAALKHRLTVEKAQWIIYVTDIGQASHFDLVFAAGRMAGWLPKNENQEPRVSHVGFGLVLGEDGKKFKTRSGDVVRLVELLDEAKERCAATIREFWTAAEGAVDVEEGGAPGFTAEELNYAASAMGYGAVKYADLKNSRTSNYRFSFDNMLSLKGDTAVYLLYAHARISSIIRKTNRDVSALARETVPTLEHPREFELALHLCRFSEALEATLEELMPHRLTSYLYDLSEKFTMFYQECRVIGSGEAEASRPASSPLRLSGAALLRPPAVRIPDLSSLRKRRLSKSKSSLQQWRDEHEREKLEKEIETKRVELEQQRVALGWINGSPRILYYFLLYLLETLRKAFGTLSNHLLPVSTFTVTVIAFLAAGHIDGPQKDVVLQVQSLIAWYGYWLFLGVLSSIGLGTGLHTGDKPAKPLFGRFICQGSITPITLSVWKIYGVVFAESFFWGTGTSIGELPPYFVARAAAKAQRIDDTREEDSLEEIAELEKTPFNELTLDAKAKLVMLRVLRHLGFFGIVLCASIPNPLFDLAGILCGHYMVPFHTFFGATFLGKAVFKSSIQTCLVILMFSRETIDWGLTLIEQRYPFALSAAQTFVDKQIASLQAGPGDDKGSIAGTIWNLVITSMTLFFITSMIKALAVDQLREAHRTQLDVYIESRKTWMAEARKSPTSTTTDRSLSSPDHRSTLSDDDVYGTIDESMDSSMADTSMTQSLIMEGGSPAKWDGAASSFL